MQRRNISVEISILANQHNRFSDPRMPHMRDDQTQARELQCNGLKLYWVGDFERHVGAKRRPLMDQNRYLHLLGTLEEAFHTRIARMDVLVNWSQLQTA